MRKMTLEHRLLHINRNKMNVMPFLFLAHVPPVSNLQTKIFEVVRNWESFNFCMLFSVVAYYYGTLFFVYIQATLLTYFANSLYKSLFLVVIDSFCFLAVPNRRSRQTDLPFGRVNTVRSGFPIRIPVISNRFLQHSPNANMLAPGA